MNISVFEAESQSVETRTPEINRVKLSLTDAVSQRILLVAQLRLLQLRAERGLRINTSSVLRLAVLARNIDECSTPAVEKSA